jgi:hypothetical protein
MKHILTLLVLFLPASTLAQTVNNQTVPGYEGTNLPEGGYSHGLMYDDAEARALWGDGQDGEAARTITGGFTTRPEIVIDGRENWINNAQRGEESPEDFMSIMENTYGDCTEASVTAGNPGQTYEYTCQSPATKSRYACRSALAPYCSNISPSCMKLVSANTGILEFSFDGSRYMYIGNRARDHIADHGNPTRINYYTAELTFEANREDVNRFKLVRMEYEDFVEVTFNGVPVFTDLDQAQYTNVKTCGGCHVINRPVSRDLNFDLRPYLRTGINTFRVRLTAVAHGNLWLKLDTDSRCCKAWSDRWSETCQ